MCRSLCAEVDYPASVLLACCLTRLAADHFVGVLDAFALVRIGLAQRADFGGGLSDLLLVDAGDGDVIGLRLDGDVDAFRNRETNRMRVAEGKDHFLPLDFGTVADADDVELALEAVGDAANVVGDQRAHQTMEGARAALIVRARELHHVVLDGDADAGDDWGGQGAFRTLDGHDVAVVFDLDAFRDGDFFSSNA